MLDNDPQVIDIDMEDAMVEESAKKKPATKAKTAAGPRVVGNRGRSAGVVRGGRGGGRGRGGGGGHRSQGAGVEYHLQVAGAPGGPVLRSGFPSISMPVPGSGFQHSLQHLDG